MAQELSFIGKDEITCPACGGKFHREELRSGSGRLIAGALTDELHREYLPSNKFGEVYPLAYNATVCPQCWFASMDTDFEALPHEQAGKAYDDAKERKNSVSKIFPHVDFHENRNLISGAASHYLVMRCYDFFPVDFSPCAKQGIAALRAAWLIEDLDKKYPGQNYDWLAKLFKEKAQFFYSEGLRREESGEEKLNAIKSFGPDTDKNYGYEGFLYLTGLLLVKYAGSADKASRLAEMAKVKSTIAKIFGMGEKSKGKPGPLLEHVRELYKSLNKELGE
ncbi:MAG: DUF2225 domain-containing protein [Spirochaetaceae bacterium]|jgi:uncharacterized protein (DUF2225 family)|nr:DUF2225 domain-containing protein [Spirochaetaceae bacterium]